MNYKGLSRPEVSNGHSITHVEAKLRGMYRLINSNFIPQPLCHISQVLGRISLNRHSALDHCNHRLILGFFLKELLTALYPASDTTI